MSKRKQKMRRVMIRKFMVLVCSIILTFMVLAGTGVAGYIYYAQKNQPEKTIAGNGKLSNGILDVLTPKKEILDINVAVFGVDKDGYRTDVIFVANFNSETKKIKLVSIPRDTRVELTDEMYNEMKKRRSRVPRVLKINGIPAYASKEKAAEYSVKELERLLGIKIDKYVKVNISAFRKIVDIVGGVRMNIPKDLRYTDHAQGLYINIKAGTQVLNGSQAEQVVRIRKGIGGYNNGDLGRIQMQHQFLKAFMNQVLEERNILNALQIAKTVFDYVETDFSLLTDVPKYIKYLGDLNSENLQMYTIPGDARNIGGPWYFIPDREKLFELVDNVFLGEEEGEEIENN